MVTNNYKVYLTPYRKGTGTSDSNFRNKQYVNTLGSSVSPSKSSSDANLYNVQKNIFCVIGTGGTPASVDDYVCEAVADTLTTLASTNDFLTIGDTTASNALYFGTALLTVRNDTDEDVVIREICMYSFTSGTISDVNQILLARDNITPLTIASGETYTFTTTINGD